MVAGPEQDVVKREDRFLGAGEDQHVVGRNSLVQRRNLGSQSRVALRFRVAEPQLVPPPPAIFVRQIEQVVERPTLDVGGAQQQVCGEFPAREETLEGEVVQAHQVLRQAAVRVRAPLR